MIEISYSGLDYYKSLDKIVRKRHMIPYAITASDTKYVVNKMYYIAYYADVMKVEYIKYDHNIIEECYVKWLDNRYGTYCTDLDILYDWIMEYDDEEIYKENDIVNNGRIYTGAEIKYWFFINDIKATNARYAEFWKFLEFKSDCFINDYAKYRVTADLDDHGNYTNCRMIKIDKIVLPGN